MNPLVQRIITALIGIPLFLGVLYLDGVYLQFLIILAVIIGLYEFGCFFGHDVYWDYLYLAGLSLLMITYSGLSSSILFIWFYLQFLYYLIRVTISNRKPFSQAWHIVAVLYVAGFFSFLGLVRAEYGFRWVFFALLVTWITDSGAYFSGFCFGNHKLAPAISPNKTVEGALGGLCAATISGLIFALVVGYDWMLLVLLSAMLSGVGQFGDLVQSTMKRERAVKDSGNLLPGHGGILDRFDSLLFVLPILYLVLASV